MGCFPLLISSGLNRHIAYGKTTGYSKAGDVNAGSRPAPKKKST